MSTATTALVSTPSKAIASLAGQLTKPATPQANIPPSPGTFRHPRLTEIIKRQSSTSLSSQKIQQAILNAFALLATIVFGDNLNNIGEKILTTAGIPPSALTPNSFIILLRLLFIANLVLCLRPTLPYISHKDDVTDIPLTPSQRVLLGLPPSGQNSSAVVPDSTGYVTPPRYRRDGGLNASNSGHSSPLAFSTGRRSTPANYTPPLFNTFRHTLGLSPSPKTQNVSAHQYRRASESPFAGFSNGSPYLHKPETSDLNQSTFGIAGGRASLANSSSVFGFGRSQSQSLRDRAGVSESAENFPGTPSPSGPKRQQGVNYKWLYDKGARLPRSESSGF